MPKIGIITQARMTSSRLPGKVLKTIAGKTLIDYHLQRLKKSQLPIVVATTDQSSDQPIVDFCHPEFPVVRGSENNVLSRFWKVVEKFNFDVIVRVTSDCPLIDGGIIRDACNRYIELRQPWVYMSNCLERTYPRGFDFEIFSQTMLKEAHQKATALHELEHVTPYFYQNLHGKTNFVSLTQKNNLSHIRLTVDEKDDFNLIKILIENHNCDQKNAVEIMDLISKHPELTKLNSHIEQKKL